MSLMKGRNKIIFGYFYVSMTLLYMGIQYYLICIKLWLQMTESKIPSSLPE